MTDANALDDAASRIEQELGPIDAWVNNAVATVSGPFSDIQPGEFKRITEGTYADWAEFAKPDEGNEGALGFA